MIWLPMHAVYIYQQKKGGRKIQQALQLFIQSEMEKL